MPPTEASASAASWLQKTEQVCRTLNAELFGIQNSQCSGSAPRIEHLTSNDLACLHGMQLLGQEWANGCGLQAGTEEEDRRSMKMIDVDVFSSSSQLGPNRLAPITDVHMHKRKPSAVDGLAGSAHHPTRRQPPGRQAVGQAGQRHCRPRRCLR